jgi:Ca2+-binding EF-hand superfamily protein
MKTTYFAMGVAALLAGGAIAGDAMRADKDGDGRVSRAEATSSSAERSGEWFDKLDADKDGYLTQEEMKQARETRHSHMKEKMDGHFKEADVNNDGQLSLDEVQAKMPRLAERFSQVDTDKNGMLSKEELQHGPRHRSRN